jgi:hypothetical protein
VARQGIKERRGMQNAGRERESGKSETRGPRPRASPELKRGAGSSSTEAGRADAEHAAAL